MPGRGFQIRHDKMLKYHIQDDHFAPHLCDIGRFLSFSKPMEKFLTLVLVGRGLLRSPGGEEKPGFGGPGFLFLRPDLEGNSADPTALMQIGLGAWLGE